MDLSAIDAASIASKRIEMEHVTPVVQKPRSAHQDRFPEREKARVTRDKSRDDSEEELEQQESEEQEEEPVNITTPNEPGSDDQDHHILDVRV
jgi:hypothetical protein